MSRKIYLESSILNISLHCSILNDIKEQECFERRISKATAFVSKQRKRIANARFTKRIKSMFKMREQEAAYGD